MLMLVVMVTGCVKYCRLAAIQDKRPVSVPLVSSKQQVTEDDRRSLMMSITALLPDHNARLRALQVLILSLTTTGTALRSFNGRFSLGLLGHSFTV